MEEQQLFDYLTAAMAAEPCVERAVLFGSRARGEHGERSDFDIACFGKIPDDAKRRLRAAVEWDAPTLHKIDLVFFEECMNGRLKQNILKEGIVFYDKDRK